MDRKITLYDYLLWTTDGNENDIDVNHISNQIGLEWDNDEIESFYKKYKNSELVNFTERYDNPDGIYRGLGYDDTVVSFSIDGMNFEIENVNGSYLHDLDDSIDDSKREEMLLSKKRMVEWAGKLKEHYDRANSDTELADCADEMADFIDEFIKKSIENNNNYFLKKLQKIW